jgi:AraC-like DNA-binding protein
MDRKMSVRRQQIEMRADHIKNEMNPKAGNVLDADWSILLTTGPLSAPKLFARIVRFNKAIDIKMNDPARSWTTIAHDCGYYDQMHFIKDFKLFSGSKPLSFFKHTPPVTENFIDPPVNDEVYR